MPDLIRNMDSAPLDNRGHEILLSMISQLLAIDGFDAKLSLILDTVVSELGYRPAAVAIIDGSAPGLEIRAADGFDAEVVGLTWPWEPDGTDLAVGKGPPSWLSRSHGEAEARFLDRLGCPGDLLDLPLAAGGLLERRAWSVPAAGRIRNAAARESEPEEGESLGALLVAADRRSLAPEAYDLLIRLAGSAGAVLASGKRTETLESTVKRLEREQQWITAILKSVADPIILTNVDNEILLQNQSAEEFLMASADASEGKLRALNMNDLLFSAYLSSAGFSQNQISRGDLTLVDPIEGTDVHFEVVSTPTSDETGHHLGLVSIFRNVTDLRRAHEEMIRNYRQVAAAEAAALRERDRLDSIIENVGDPVVVSDASGEILLCNRGAEAFFLHGESAWTSAAPVRENAVKLTSFITNFISEPSVNYRSELHLIDPETRETLPMEVTAVKIPDAHGEMTTVVSVLHDLSEIRELERRRVEQKLLESQKLAAIGRLTASLAHEINNPLEAIKNALYLQRTRGVGNSQDRFLDIALKETERMSETVTRMLGFARTSEEPERVIVSDLVEETLVLLQPKLKETGVGLQRQFQKNLPPVYAQADQLRQVFLNIMLNAQQAIQGRGKITVRTAAENDSRGPWVIVEVSDTGCGISEEDRARIFEPFFSMRKNGTGLGLWVTHDIVRANGGRIEVRSVVNQGTTFRIILPGLDQPRETANRDREEAGRQ